MNICLCGAKVEHVHDRDCPYPLYKSTREQYAVWMQARRARRRLRLKYARADANRTRGLADSRLTSGAESAS